MAYSAKKIAAVIVALSTMLTAGCNSASNTKTTTASETLDAGATRIVKDIDGTEVEVPQTVNRIADLWHANNQVVLLLGGADKLVSTTQAIKGLPWFKTVYPKIDSIPAPVKGTDVNMEEMLATNPDVVLSSNDKQVEDARAAGVPTVKVDFQNFDNLKRTVEITADVIGTDEAKNRAQEFSAYLDKNLEMVQSKLADLSDSDKPKVLHIAGGDDLTKVDGSNSLIGEWMKAAGAQNSIDGVANLKNITLEEIIQSNPDIIIIGGTKSKEGIEKIKNDPAWADVPAVQNNKLISNPVGTFNWDRYSAEEALQVLWAAKTFHEDKFQDIDLVSETQQFYKKYYDYDLSTEEANLILAGDPPQ